MFRNYLLLLLLTIGFIALPGCSLFSSDNEEGAETSTEEISDEGGEVVETEEGTSEDDEEIATSEDDSMSSSTDEFAANTNEDEEVCVFCTIQSNAKMLIFIFVNVADFDTVFLTLLFKKYSYRNLLRIHSQNMEARVSGNNMFSRLPSCREKNSRSGLKH